MYNRVGLSVATANEEEVIMKKGKWYSILLLVLLLTSWVVGCESAPTSAPPTQPHPVTESPPQEQPSPGAEVIQWYEAKDHIGERTTVCGPIVSAMWATGSTGKPTFLNIGKPYPDPSRFTVVIWEDYRANFPQAPEVYYSGKTICVTGLIVPYDGVPEIEVKTPTQIEEQ